MGKTTHSEDTARVSKDGVSIERTLVCDEDAIFATMGIRSERDDPVLVHVVDQIPADLSIDEVSFKPGDEPDMGETSMEHVSIRHQIDDAAARINYGIFPSEPVTEIDWGQPDIREVFSVDEAQSGEDGSGSMATVMTAETAVNGATVDPDGEQGAPTLGTGRSSRPEQPDTAGQGERRARDVPRRVEVRLDRLSARVEKFAAYATTLEEIIDEYGAGTEVVDEFHAHLDDLESRLDTVEADVATNRAAVTEEIDEVWEDLDGVESAVDDLAEDTTRLESTVQGHDAQLETLQEAVDENQDALESVQGRVSEQADQFDAVEDDVASLHGSVGDLESDVSTIGDAIDDLRTDLETLETELEELKAFRKSLAEISFIEDG